MPLTTRSTTATLAVAVSLTLALAGCSDGESSAETAPPSSPPSSSSPSSDPTATGVPTRVPGLEEATRSEKPRPSADPSGSEMPSVEAIEEATLSPRGYLEKEVDDLGGILLAEPDILALRIWLRGITWDPVCADGSSPSNGRFLALDFEVATTTYYAEGDELTITADQFAAFDSSDRRTDAEGSALDCVAVGDRLPVLTADDRGQGRVILDVPGDTVVVAFEPYTLYGGGWEYPIPAAP